MKANEKKMKEAGWLFLPAFMMIGMGLGFLYGNVAIGLFIGMGTGFLVKAILSYRNSINQERQ